MWAIHPAYHPTNNVKVLKETKSTDPTRGVFQDLPTPNTAWLLGNRSLTLVDSGQLYKKTLHHW